VSSLLAFFFSGEEGGKKRSELSESLLLASSWLPLLLVMIDWIGTMERRILLMMLFVDP
jgi:hypothetical protein